MIPTQPSLIMISFLLSNPEAMAKLASGLTDKTNASGNRSPYFTNELIEWVERVEWDGHGNGWPANVVEEFMVGQAVYDAALAEFIREQIGQPNV